MKMMKKKLKKRQKRIIEDQKILITAIALHQQRSQKLTEKMLAKLKADMEERIIQTEKKLLLAIHKPKIITTKGSIFSIKIIIITIIIAVILFFVIRTIISVIRYIL